MVLFLSFFQRNIAPIIKSKTKLDPISLHQRSHWRNFSRLRAQARMGDAGMKNSFLNASNLDLNEIIIGCNNNKSEINKILLVSHFCFVFLLWPIKLYDCEHTSEVQAASGSYGLWKCKLGLGFLYFEVRIIFLIFMVLKNRKLFLVKLFVKNIFLTSLVEKSQFHRYIKTQNTLKLCVSKTAFMTAKRRLFEVDIAGVLWLIDWFELMWEKRGLKTFAGNTTPNKLLTINFKRLSIHQAISEQKIYHPLPYAPVRRTMLLPNANYGKPRVVLAVFASAIYHSRSLFLLFNST